MDIIYRRDKATATEVMDDMPDPPSRTAVRTLLRILEEKGHLKHTKKSREFVYQAIRARKQAGRSAFRRTLHTFFDGSLEKAVAAHLADPAIELSEEQLKRLNDIIRETRKMRSRS